MHAVQPKHAVTYAGAAFNIYHADTGEGLPKHEHEFAHATFCTAGSCVIRKEGRELVLNKNSMPVNLIANEWHELEALEDGTVFINVFAAPK